MTGEETEPSISHIESLPVIDDDVIVTSLAWHPTALDQLAVTLTNGNVNIILAPSSIFGGRDVSSHHTKQISEDNNHTTTHMQHSLEAWTSIILPSNWPYSGLLSGGDDAVLAYSPLPSNHVQHDDEPPQPEHLSSWSNRRIHSAGVTAILPLPIKAASMFVCLTGSYDDHLRVLSLPGLPGATHVRQPQVLHEIDLGGGVWRLKLITESTQVTTHGRRCIFTILVSCMYAGAKIVELSLRVNNGNRDGAGVWESRVVAMFSEHQSMCYACDVQESCVADVEKGGAGGGAGGGTARRILSCSFYDRRLCLWRWN